MRQKLKLKVEELQIEQFHVQPPVATTKGTVRGLESYTCGGCPGSMQSPTADPCGDCPNMPITYSCDDSSCC
jgi:hypothetical protein